MATERWISRDFGALVAKSGRAVGNQNRPLIFDVVIVGSGYGGAIAAAELAGCKDADSGLPITVCVLERGLEYLPGMFPARTAELPRHLRFSTPQGRQPGGQREGLFDFRVGTDVSAVVANGLGGGSLINAGVMEIPKPAVFDKRWPQSLHGRGALDHYYSEARGLLGAEKNGQSNTIDRDASGAALLQKHQAFAALQGDAERFRKAAITIADEAGHVTAGGVQLKPCTRCGDCATGCNHSAKESLDTNLLVRAYHQGAEIYTGVTVINLEKEQKNGQTCWTLNTTHTDRNLSLREGKTVGIHARHVILAAGALGSTELLLRSQKRSSSLLFSEQLGQGFSTNGDMIASGFGQSETVNAVADERVPPGERKIGPTITAIIETQGGKPGDTYRPALILEELAIPGPLRRAFEEVYSTAATLSWFEKADKTRHRHEHPVRDPFAVNPRSISHSQIYAAMGDDGAQGSLKLGAEADDCLADGAIRVHWPGISRHPLFERQIEKLDELARKSRLGGITIANPLWQLLPTSMQPLINNQRGPLLTVHPLGGCRMADSAGEGVVSDCGEVYRRQPTANGDRFYEGLAVLDGAIIPSALETNPALTIAAVSLRAVRALRKKWQLTPAEAPVMPAGPRPLWRDVTQDHADAQRPKDTVGEFTERLSGAVTLRDATGKPHEYFAELTLFYEPKSITSLVEADTAGRLIEPVLKLTSGQPGGHRNSRLRILEMDAWQRIREKNCASAQRENLMDQQALLIAPLQGSLTIMRREASHPCWRRMRGLWAWIRNRGLRDSWQYFTNRHEQRKKQQDGKGIFARIYEKATDACKLASHAGEVRLFEYDLEIAPPDKLQEDFAWPVREATQRLAGKKRITYGRPSNPWRQLMEMTVLEMPGLIRGCRYKNRLELDNGFMANMGIPLFRIIQQENQVQAFSDLAALLGYIARTLFSIHIWSARLPEPPLNEPNRLPGRLPEMPVPEIIQLEVDRHDGQPVYIRLCHYPAKNADAIPVAMFHGYSASGTTFAHPAPPENIARTLHKAGRDVWVVDLRTSCGLPTAVQPWTFERVALKDIPAAIDHIYHRCGRRKIDVLAHCMGSVMFSMSVLTAERPAARIITDWDKDFRDDFRAERQALPGRIRRLVMSQVGPLVVFTPRNVFSGYVTNYLRYFLPVENYRFRQSANPGLAEQLMDRLLATLPYPDDEILLENPAWPPWRGTEYVGTRHRMDAMYGRDFKLANLDQNTLDHVDDFFGPLNPETVSQVVHFTRLQMITNRYGRNRFIFRQAMKKYWTFPTLSIHGEENGLSDIATLERMRSEMHQTGRQFEIFRVPGYGHQDCWIGKNASTDVFPRILEFLHGEMPAHTDQAPRRLLVQTAWAGPVVGLPAFTDAGRGGSCVPVSLSAKPSLGRPLAVVLLRVTRAPDGQTWQVLVGDNALPSGSDIPESAMQIIPVGQDTEDWFRVDIPADMFRPPAQAVMVLTTHDQTPTLAVRTFDENF